jgi:hypothetical protein
MLKALCGPLMATCAVVLNRIMGRRRTSSRSIYLGTSLLVSPLNSYPVCTLFIGLNPSKDEVHCHTNSINPFAV